MTNTDDYSFTTFLTDLDHLHRAWHCLEVGDLLGVFTVMNDAPPMLRRTQPFQHLLAAALLMSGRLEEASEAITRYVDARPDDFDGIELAYRIVNLLNADDGQEALATLGRRRVDLLVRYLEGLTIRYGVNWPAIVHATIRSDEISYGFKARILIYTFLRIMSEVETADVTAMLADELMTFGPRDRLLAASVLMAYCGESDLALTTLEALIAGGHLIAADFPAVANEVNLRMGMGDEVVHRRRHHILSLLYDAWVADIQAGLPPAHFQMIDRIRVTPTTGRRIAILTPPLIHAAHSPTNRVLEIACALQRDFGYEVKIFAGGALHYRTGGAVASVSFSNVTAAHLAAQSLEHGGVKLAMWGVFLDDSQIQKFSLVAVEITKFQPDAVLCYGDASPVQALLSGRLPLVLFPSNSTPPVGPADRYVSLWDEAALARRVDSGEWPPEIAEKAVFGAAGAKIAAPDRRFSRDDLAPGAGLLLVAVGTRLAGELRGEFAIRLADLMADRPSVHLLTIGVSDRAAVIGKELESVADRVICLARRADLANLLTGCDIFINPDRQGGGTGMAMAMAAECAVVSLVDGDGATLLAAEDLSADFDAYFARLAALIDDPAACAEMAARMPDQVDRVLGFDRSMRVLVDTLEAVAAEARAPRA